MTPPEAAGVCRSCRAMVPSGVVECPRCGSFDVDQAYPPPTEEPQRHEPQQQQWRSQPTRAEQHPQQAGWWDADRFPSPPPPAMPVPERYPPPPGRSRGQRNRAPLAIGIGAGLVVALIAVAAVVLLGRSSTSAEAARTPGASPSSLAASSQSASQAPASTAPSASTTTTTVTESAPPAYPVVAITGTPCGSSGSSPYSRAAAGNDHTSCPFAQAVRGAYVASGADGSNVTVQAYSRVTKKWYVMTCVGSQPVQCTGGNDALVWLYGGDATFS
jgi:hypothetical protein